MNKQSARQDWIGKLREKAEAELESKLDANLQSDSAKELLHELRVYRIELEMQNETLRQTQLALEEARDRYLDLFEFAPVGYLILTPAGLISEINLTGTALFNRERTRMLERRFAHFVLPEDRDRWYVYLLDLLQQSGKKNCQLRLLRGDGSSFRAMLNGVSQKKEEDQVVIRLVLTELPDSL